MDHYDYALSPKSIAEIKADRAHDAKLWSARDALISLLRAVDAGEVDIDLAVICYRDRINGEYQAHCSAAGGSGLHEPLGLLTRCIHLMNEQ